MDVKRCSCFFWFFAVALKCGAQYHRAQELAGLLSGLGSWQAHIKASRQDEGIRSTADKFVRWLLRALLQSALWGHTNFDMKQSVDMSVT